MVQYECICLPETTGEKHCKSGKFKLKITNSRINMFLFNVELFA